MKYTVLLLTNYFDDDRADFFSKYHGHVTLVSTCQAGEINDRNISDTHSRLAIFMIPIID